MEVTAVYAQDFMCPMHKPDTFMNCNFNDQTRANLIENILYNTEAHIEINENAFYVPVGNGTECSLIRWLQGNEIPVQKEMLKREGKIKAWIPFDTNLKRSIIAIDHPEIQNTVRVYVKGAPEIVIENCIRYNDGNNNALPIDQQNRDYVINQMMRDQMTTKGFRTMAFSYKDYDKDEFEGLSDFNSDATIKELENGQTFCGIVGLKDPLRDRMKHIVEYAQKGGINIRMISGDNIDTAKAMAVDAGILSQNEFSAEASIDDQRKFFMDAKDFRQEVGDL
jgi:magnesium-transporting ATPase (P-type)